MWHDAKKEKPPEDMTVIGLLETSREKVFCWTEDLEEDFFVYTDDFYKRVKISHWTYDETGLPDKE